MDKQKDEMEDIQGAFRANWQLKCIFAVVGLLNFAAALDATSITTALPTIADDLGGTAIEAFWSGTSFLVTSAVFQPIFSLSSDIFGRKAVLTTAVVFFTIGSILAAVSNTFQLLLPGRAIQGTGAGGIIALTEVLIADLIPLKERGKWFSVRSGTWALGSVLGPVIGGAFAESSWRWVFWINLPFCGLGLVLIPIFLRLQRDKVPVRQKLAKVDYLGCGIFIASLSSFLIPLTWGGVMYAWDSWHTLLPLILGAAGLLGFVVYERFIPSEPLIPHAIFSNRTVIINYLGCFLHGVILWSLVYYLPLYYQGALGYGAIISGVAVFPECFTVAPVSVMSGFAVAKTGRYRWAVWGGWALSTLGMGLISLLDSDSSIPKWIFLNLVPGVGLGVLFSSVMLAVQASANSEYLSMSVTLTAFFRTVGQAVGVAVGGVVFQNRIQREFETNPLLRDTAAEFARDASALVEYIKDLPGGERRDALEDAYSNALSVLWLVMCGVAGVGFLTSLCIKGYTLCQAFTSKQGLKTTEEEDVETLRGDDIGEGDTVAKTDTSMTS